MRHGNSVVVDRVGLSVAPGQILCVLGPSGSGKTSLLRAIAGLQRCEGTVRFADEDLTDTPPNRRRFGLMFQDHALFPHLDTAGNVAFGPKVQGWDAATIRNRVSDVLDLVGLGRLGARPVSALSGGEQQRVALARALAPRPLVLLLDEPLGSLDRGLRDRLATEIRDLVELTHLAAVYVTHDHEEAFAVAHHLAVMRDGAVVQRGTPTEVWGTPADAWVARFLGFQNLLPQGEAFLLIRPDAFSPDPTGDLDAVVERRTYRGDHFRLRVQSGRGPLDVDARWTPVPEVGERLRLKVDPARTVVVGAGERRAPRD